MQQGTSHLLGSQIFQAHPRISRPVPRPRRTKCDPTIQQSVQASLVYRYSTTLYLSYMQRPPIYQPVSHA